MCGVVGLHAPENGKLSYYIFYALLALQHRGQESCGITVRGRDFVTEKGMGQVNEVFNFEKLNGLKGEAGIGHVRYSTTGESELFNAQPFVVRHSHGTIAIAHNGNIVNAEELREKLKAAGQAFVSTTDTEVIAHLIVREYLRTGDMVEAISMSMRKLVGSYSLVLLTDDALIGVRDPLGIRPLSMGRMGKSGVIFASETVAFDVINAEFERDVKPGEIVVVSEEGVHSHRPYKLPRRAHCMFEYVYFSRPDSVLNGIPVYEVREKLGMLMAEEDDTEADLVTPIPDSAIPFALGYSRAKGVPYREGLIRNRYVGRTFILPSQQARELAVKLKLNPLVRQLSGKRVVLFDDSIVRGTTSRRIISLLRGAGAKEVHMRVGCPPIRSPCMLGIDMPTRSELIAGGRSVEEIRRIIGADTLRYTSLEALVKAIGLRESELCLGCITGRYPVEIARYQQLRLPVYMEHGQA
ncbi:MAG: amidophosphoribosyltransferase [Euryarchaeota archaeon]|nr:amidophosphoribosyltransferase [Euryarchaeota archaeon]